MDADRDSFESAAASGRLYDFDEHFPASKGEFHPRQGLRHAIDEVLSAGVRQPYPNNGRADAAQGLHLREVFVLGNNCSACIRCVRPNGGVGGLGKPAFADVLCGMSLGVQPQRQCRRQTGRRPETASGDAEHRVVRLAGGVLERRGDVFGL